MTWTGSVSALPPRDLQVRAEDQSFLSVSDHMGISPLLSFQLSLNPGELLLPKRKREDAVCLVVCTEAAATVVCGFHGKRQRNMKLGNCASALSRGPCEREASLPIIASSTLALLQILLHSPMQSVLNCSCQHL